MKAPAGETSNRERADQVLGIAEPAHGELRIAVSRLPVSAR